jgi:phosphate transport system substrate-binding protein
MRRKAFVKNFTAFTLTTTAILLAICLTFVSAAGLGQSTPLILVATGSTMLQPLYVLWGDEYQKAHPATQVHYLPVGTSESANRILSGTGDLGGGDAPIPEQQLKDATNAAMELPTVLVGIAVFYNLPGHLASIHLTGPLLANIYLGKTTSWSDREIAKLNPDSKLPDLPIKVLHRTDGKGSNYIFSDFLSRSVRISKPRWERMFRQSGWWAALSADARICSSTRPRRRAPSGIPSCVAGRNPD